MGYGLNMCGMFVMGLWHIRKQSDSLNVCLNRHKQSLLCFYVSGSSVFMIGHLKFE